MSEYDEDISAEFGTYLKEVYSKLEKAAEQAGPGYEARVGDGEVRLQTTDGRQQLIFRRTGALLDVAFHDATLPDERVKSWEQTFALLPFRKEGKEDVIISVWLNMHGPKT